MKKIQAGDILVEEYGYNCSLVNFYKVIELTPSGKSVRMVKIDWDFVEDDGYGQSGYVIPCGKQSGVIMTKRICFSTYSQEECVKLHNTHAYIWNGKKIYYNSMD